jgi:WD40 repeat protein
MASLFISYSRKDIEFAHKLTEAFKGQDLDFWIDWEGIPPTVDWWNEIQKGIEEADIFLFLISPDSAKSRICRQEIEHAAKNGKRLIPVVVCDISADESPAELRTLNWIFLRDPDEFHSGFSKLITAIKTDYEWVQSHRQLLVKALEWERSNHENSFLLRGKELQDAESQLVTNSSKEPHPTELQREYVLKSRQASDRQRRTTTSIAVAGVVTLAILAVFGFLQARLATSNAAEAQAASTLAISNANTAQAASTLAIAQQATALASVKEIQNQLQIINSGNLASQSVAVRNRDASLSLLLSVEAFNMRDTDQTRSILMDNVYTKPQLSPYQILNDGYGYNSIALSPDGKLLASGDEVGNITLWNMETGQPEGQPLNDGREGYISSLAFSSNGKTLAAVYNKVFENSLVLWDVETGMSMDVPLTILPYHAAFSPNGKILAAGGSDGLILWDVEAGKPAEKQLDDSTFYVGDFAFSPDGKTLAMPAPHDNSIIVWNTETGQQITQLTSPYNAQIITFSPDGKILAADDDYTVLWDTKTWQMIGQPLAHGSIGYSLYNIAFSPDSRILATPDGDGGVLLRDVKTGQTIVQPLLHRYNDIFPSMTGITFSPDGKKLFTSGLDGYGIALWDVSRLNVIPVQPIIQQIYGPGERSVWDIALSPDGKILVMNSVDDKLEGNITMWDTETAQSIGEPLNGLAGSTLAFSPNGKILATGEENGILLSSVETRQPFGHLPDAYGNFTFSPDGKILVVGGPGGVFLWDMETRHLIGQLKTGDLNLYSDIVFSADGKTLIASDLYGSLALWDLATHQSLTQKVNQNTGDWISGTALSPDGQTVAWINDSSHDATILLCDVKTGQCLGQPLNGNSGSVKSIKFSPDRKTLVSGYEDGTIILWGVETGLRIGQPLASPAGNVTKIAFSSDGKILATLGTKDFNVDVITLWDMDPESWMEKACQLAGKNLSQTEWAQYFPGEEYRKTCEQWPLELGVSATPTATP